MKHRRTKVNWGVVWWAVGHPMWRHEPPTLLWDGEARIQANRAMLFMSRSEARKWCREERESYKAYPDGHPCRDWRWKVVPVTVTYQWDDGQAKERG